MKAVPLPTFSALVSCCAVFIFLFSATAFTTAANLRITELQSSQAPSPNLPTADWWELTSFESSPVDLSAWRFNDNSGGLTDPFTIGSGVIINPGESIVFVEGLTPAQFRTWWGATNLPSDLQIITYAGAGLSFGASGDGLRLWDNFTTDANTWVDAVDFGAAVTGVSFNFDPLLMSFGQLSQLGINGVVTAGASTDLGSPGRIKGLAVQPTLYAAVLGNYIRITFAAEGFHRYSLEMATEGTESWSPSGDWLRTATDSVGSFQKERTTDAQFFRVAVE